MKVLEKNENWELRHPSKKNIIKVLPAKKLWEAIIANAWSNGDPGFIFLDLINASNPYSPKKESVLE